MEKNINSIYKRFTVKTLVFFILSISGQSQDLNELPFHTFENISSQDGVNLNGVNCFFQDSKGFIWLGTSSGMCRFDGYKLISFSHSDNINSLGNGDITEIIEDKFGYLWISNKNTGLERFDPRTNVYTHYPLKSPDSGEILDTYISTLAIDDTVLWVGGASAVYMLPIKPDNVQNPTIRCFDMYKYFYNETNPLHFARPMVIDSMKNIWVSSNHGLYRISFKQLNYNKPVYKRIHNDNSFKVVMDKQQRLWASILGDLYNIESYTSQNPKAVKFNSIIGINDICFDKKNDVWLSLIKKGVVNAEINYKTKSIKYKSYSERQKSEPKSLSSNIINDIFIDRTNVIWIGSRDGGADKLDLEKKRIRHIEKGETPGRLLNNYIWSFCEDKHQNLWIGTEGGGLFFLPQENSGDYDQFQNIKRNINTAPNFLCSNTIFCIIESKYAENRIYVGSPGLGYTVITRDNSSGKIYNDIYSPPEFHAIGVRAFLEEPDALWIGTQRHGLYKVQQNSKGEITNMLNFKNINNDTLSLTGNVVRSIFKDSRGEIWIGTTNGLNKMFIQKDGKVKFKVYKNLKTDALSISGNNITEILEDKNGTLWVGTLGNGLNKIVYNNNSKDISFIRFNADHGLVNNYVKAILSDDKGNLWVSTNNGISKFNTSYEIFQNLSIEDGLQDNKFLELSSCKRVNGQMLFGGINGFNTFSPDSINKNLYIPKATFTGIKIENSYVLPGDTVHGRIVLDKNIEYSKEIIISRRSKVLELEFTANHYASPPKNKFSYKLEGYDKTWSKPSATNSCLYADIPSGTYVLKVRASNNDNIWIADSLELSIKVLPYFWLRWWAFGIYILIIFISLLIFRRYTIIKVNRKNDLLMQKFEKEKIDQLSKLKLDFFTSISHEFRTPLMLITTSISQVFESDKNNEFVANKRNIAVIKRNINVLLRLIKQLSDFRKLEQNKLNLVVSKADIVAFTHDIFDSFRIIADNNNISYNFNSEKEHLYIYFDPDKIEKVLFNLISNALKFTLEGGKVKVQITDNDDDVIIHVCDNGIGIPKDKQDRIFELFYRADNLKNMGTGVGLAFSKKLIELHKGQLDFESKEGFRTVFTIKLSKNDSSYKIDEITTETRTPNNLTKNLEWSEPVFLDKIETDNLNKMVPNRPTILIVDDNIEVRQMLIAQFAGYNIVEAGNGREGFEKIMNSAPDLIITDIMMPEMDGFELCKKIKLNEETFHIPLILLTARGQSEDQLKGLKLEADDYFSKPVNMELLKTRVDILIQTRKKLIARFQKKIVLEPKELLITSSDTKFLQRVLKITERNISNPEFSVINLTEEVGMTIRVLNRKLNLLVQKTASEFVREIKMKRAAQLLLLGSTVTDAALETGYNSVQHFRKCFKQEFHCTPSEYIEKNATES